MQWLALVCVRRPVFAWVLMLVVLVLGVAGYAALGVDQFPNVDIPYAIVTTRLDGAAPEEVETDITEKIESAVNTIAGIDELRSVSGEGYSQVLIAFNIDRAADSAVNDVRDRINSVQRLLPKGTDPPVVTKLDPDDSPVLMVSLRSALPIRDVTEIADKLVRRQIENISGVGQVRLLGGRAREIQIWLDPLKLRALNMSAVEVSRALAAENLSSPGGRIETGPESVTLRVVGRVASVEGIGRIVVREAQGHVVRIDDLGRVEDGQEEASSLASYDGEQTVMLAVRKQSGTNTAAVVDRVRARLGQVTASLPPGVELAIVRDNSASIRTGLDAVKEHLVLGALLAAVVVLCFLGNARSTVIAGLSIPISIVGTFGLMWAQGFTLNMMTLLALALAVGIVIDDAIVVLENIVRYVQVKGVKPFPAAILATREIGLPVLSTTLSLMAVFVPVAFVGGILGRFLKNFGYTMAFAVGISLLVSFSLTPMLSARHLRAHDGAGGRLSRIVDVCYRPIERAYMRILRASLQHRWVLVVVCFAALGSCIPLAARVPKSFLPPDDQAQFEVSLRAPEGTSAAQTALVAERVAEDIRALAGVAHTVATVGGGDQASPNVATLYVALTDPSRRAHSQNELMAQVRSEVLAKLSSELRTSVMEVAAMSSGTSTAAVQYVLAGPDLARLSELAAQMLPRIARSPAVVDLDTNLILGRPELRASVDRERAADLGVTVSDVAETLLTHVGGVKASSYTESGEAYDVRVRADEVHRDSAQALSVLTVPSSKHGTAPLSAVVSLSETTGPVQINRVGRQRQVTFTANVAQGKSESDVVQAMQDAFAALNAPPEYRLAPTGRSKTAADLAAGFVVTVAMSFVFMYLILAAQFESWLYPFVILLSLPLTVPFALLSLLAFGQGLNLMSALGILVLFAVVKKNAILQVDHANNLRASGMSMLEATLAANRDRLRPILMTTIAFVAGMLPLAFSNGIGSGNNRNISGIVIGGQTFSLLLTLLAVPVVHSLFEQAREWIARRRKRAAVDLGEAELDALAHVHALRAASENAHAAE